MSPVENEKETSLKEPEKKKKPSTNLSSSSKDNDPNNNPSFLTTQGFVLGLLGSSCCLLQLAINILSFFNIIHIGCAGFNKYLSEPIIRSYIRAITFGWLGFVWFGSMRRSNRRNDKQLWKTTFITLLVMFLPDTLQLWEEKRYSSLHPVILRSLGINRIDNDRWIKTEFIVENMDCEACEYNVRNILEGAPFVKQAYANWTSEHAMVWTEKDDDNDDDIVNMTDLSKRLKDRGYELHSDLNYITRRKSFEQQPVLEDDGSDEDGWFD